MIRALWTASTGMEAQQLNIDLISHNLANVNTTGFKKSRADYQDLLYQELKSPGASSSTTTMIPTGLPPKRANPVMIFLAYSGLISKKS